MEVIIGPLVRLLIVVGLARLIYELVTPITPLFLVVLAVVVGVRFALAARRYV